MVSSCVGLLESRMIEAKRKRKLVLRYIKESPIIHFKRHKRSKNKHMKQRWRQGWDGELSFVKCPKISGIYNF